MSVTIIAEVRSVHDGSFGNAQRLIDLAAECRADVVKFQTHIGYKGDFTVPLTEPLEQGQRW